MARQSSQDLLFLSLLIPLLLLAGCAGSGDGAGAVAGDYARPSSVCADGTCIPLEHAGTPAARAKGLMYRDTLSGGMLFHFGADGYPGIWMKNMLIPIDILWLDSTLRVVHLVADAPPCAADPCPVYTPSHPARYVLELPAGFAGQHGLSVGDILSFSP
ncbi:DUF192 domain-containing protein [Candidatus Woesearchaeota archaeon]|nr:DUF192 domain-containing protein [Candidatus Woesearchaeota archaeon]